MYTETNGSRKAIGDVDIVYHDGLYHLFHLVLPNHDFIAHAISADGINWQRITNALFIGDPGSWDDLMLWTMHVSPDPDHSGNWRMFYTGLSRKDQGNVQRIGLATSPDLYHWTKADVRWQENDISDSSPALHQALHTSRAKAADSRRSMLSPDSCFPIEASAEYYESHLGEGRQWVSFRDPFFFQTNSERWLLVSSRVKHGPIVRRGCVGLYSETSPGKFEAKPALHHPRLYDDIEVPNLLRIADDYYLIGSIREDAKIRYWHTKELHSPWRSYHDNVLMPQGNYAGRVCKDEKGWLLWNFYSLNQQDRTLENLMPPPKRLIRKEDGLLRATTFEGFDTWVREKISTRCIRSLTSGLPDELCVRENGNLDLESESGFHAFVFDERLSCMRFRADLQLNGLGKCGLVLRVDPISHDGYYLSLDLIKGLAQLRSWGTGQPNSGEKMMQFHTLQSANWFTDTPGSAKVQLLAFGSYIEFSVDGRVVLSLADSHFQNGLFGIYLETAKLRVENVELHRLEPPHQSEEHLTLG